MKKIILCIVAAFLVIFFLFTHFVSGISSTYPPIKRYRFEDNKLSLINKFKHYCSTDSIYNFRVNDTTGSGQDLNYYSDLKINSEIYNIIIELKFKDYHKDTSTTELDIIGLHDLFHKTGGYKESDQGVKTLLDYFDNSFLKEFNKTEKTNISSE